MTRDELDRLYIKAFGQSAFDNLMRLIGPIEDNIQLMNGIPFADPHGRKDNGDKHK